VQIPRSDTVVGSIQLLEQQVLEIFDHEPREVITNHS
jgi:hypothetical protein